ncbi:helix-turn-helix domain-containing protein [Streptomyces pini]|uniref:Helix-turn-helix domain-containing protein n=1 Tax=Streptomyces pini TaxID=1520580 RepID=A0A1I3YYD3_9ACTN|nr:helix-turn-helix transcriptional regulator [Streptomyces pini]SFK36221.1 Helix-turn-helix domain-containing protein [Streptomyces pini]
MAEARPNVHRRRLGSALRSLRIAAGFNMEEAAERLGLSGKSALSKIENGKQRVSGLGLTAFFQVYGVDAEDTRAKIRAMASLAASGKRTNLLDEYREAIQTRGFEEYLYLEGMASKAESYLQMVPGLLQTKEYATSIVERSQVWSSKREVSRFVDLRLARQGALTRSTPLSLWCILDEAALRRVVGGPEVMKDQLERLLEVTEEHSHVVVQVLPFEAGAHAGIDGSFQLLHFPAGPPIAVVEAKTTSLYLEEDGDVDRYQSALDTLRTQALDAQATRRFIQELIKDCRI